jgi:hypothetical protein
MSVYQSMRGGGHPLPPWIRYCVPGKANLAAYVQGSRRFWQTALISGSRGFRALKGPILGRLAIRRKCSRQSLVLAVIEKIKPPMLSHGGFHMLGCRLDAISADIIGADEADRAETRVELLQAAFRAACREFAVPGDLDGILSVEDEEHWGILRPGPAGFVVCFRDGDNPLLRNSQWMKSSSNVANRACLNVMHFCIVIALSSDRGSRQNQGRI